MVLLRNLLVAVFFSVLFTLSHFYWRPYLNIWLTETPNSSPATALNAPRSTLKVIQFNVDHGGETRIDAVLAWLKQENADVVGFCEANNWQYNLSGIAFAAGYSYSEIFPTHHGYPLAVFSKTPIVVRGQHGGTHFERGVLHVEIRGIHFFIAHLNAHSAAARELETFYLANLILTVENNRTVGSSGPPFVVVMGDMNTLSPRDDTMLQQMTIENHTLLQALSSMPCYNSMKKKFLKYPWYNEFNYEPMHHLLQRANLIDTSILRRPTEPTNIPCDQAKHCTCPHLRLDYMLVSKQFTTLQPVPTSKVIMNNRTMSLSDHFPIELTIAHR